MQTFKNRVVDVMDQAQHFGGSGAVSSSSGEEGHEFREGLDATERECKRTFDTASTIVDDTL